MESPKQKRLILLVNAVDNPDAALERESFSPQWGWLETPAGWNPRQGLPDGGRGRTPDAVIVFSTKYEERAVRELCEAVRNMPELEGVPMLVAVNQYEMPLANRVRKMPRSHFVFTPVTEQDVVSRLDELTAGEA